MESRGLIDVFVPATEVVGLRYIGVNGHGAGAGHGEGAACVMRTREGMSLRMCLNNRRNGNIPPHSLTLTPFKAMTESGLALNCSACLPQSVRRTENDEGLEVGRSRLLDLWRLGVRAYWILNRVVCVVHVRFRGGRLGEGEKMRIRFWG